MKKIIFYIFISINLVGCEESFISNYSLSNTSGITVIIIPYNMDGTIDVAKKITLKNGGNVSAKKKTSYPAPNQLDIEELISKDQYTKYSKIEIVFNNSQKITYSRCRYTDTLIKDCDEPRNIFRHEYNDEKTEVYTITPEDYENAIDCNGDCY